ncbi:MAG: hypothetical protein ACRCX8_01090, partial [Sarcina sp.]
KLTLGINSTTIITMEVSFIKARQKFVSQLEQYYEHLLDRLGKGSVYLNNMKGDVYNSKEYKIYENLIKELSEVEKLINYYKDT